MPNLVDSRQLLVTGATGNVGVEILSRFADESTGIKVFAGVRDIESAKARIKALDKLECRHFDFEDPTTFATALSGIDIVFLLRPPHLADVERYFSPLVDAFVENQVTQVVFLSVQGAEKLSMIPHRKIEVLLQKKELATIFLRPSYFMQNLTTNLWEEIHSKRSISLPSGKGQFNWLDIEDLADLTHALILNFEAHKNSAMVVSGQENLDFATVIDRMNQICGTSIVYNSVSPWRYIQLKRAEGMKLEKVFVTLMLHFLPRIQGPPSIAPTIEAILARKPRSIAHFIHKHKIKFE
jgi:uncharacterized protein YbjT (DUF2867 family)